MKALGNDSGAGQEASVFKFPQTTKLHHPYLSSCREKMGSHLLVETTRNPDCPKVRLRRWSDSYSLVTDGEPSS